MYIGSRENVLHFLTLLEFVFRLHWKKLTASQLDFQKDDRQETYCGIDKRHDTAFGDDHISEELVQSELAG